MRGHYQNNLDNTMNNMFNANRRFIEQEITRKGSLASRDSQYRRNGTLNFGARQMVNYIPSGFFVIGSGATSPIVGP